MKDDLLVRCCKTQMILDADIRWRGVFIVLILLFKYKMRIQDFEQFREELIDQLLTTLGQDEEDVLFLQERKLVVLEENSPQRVISMT